MKYFYSLNDFPFLDTFIQNKEVIIKEYNEFLSNAQSFIDSGHNFKESDPATLKWIEQQKNDPSFYEKGGNANNWVVITVFKDNFIYKNFFSKTNKLLKEIKKLNYSGFFNLKSDQSIPYHKHEINTYIFHMNLFDLRFGTAHTYVDLNINVDPMDHNIPQSRCYEKRILSKPGDYVIFSPKYYHCAKNKSATNRITFGVEFYE